VFNVACLVSSSQLALFFYIGKVQKIEWNTLASAILMVFESSSVLIVLYSGLGILGAARVPLAFELMRLSHYLSRTAQRLVQIPYGIQVSHGFGRLHGKVDWIKNIDESAVLATAYDPTYRLYTGRKTLGQDSTSQCHLYPYRRVKPNVGLASTVKRT
jgi:hypothetical protein